MMAKLIFQAFVWFSLCSSVRLLASLIRPAINGPGSVHKPRERG